MARKEGKVLPDGYWQSPPWSTIHNGQLIIARELIDRFSFQAVSRALISSAKGKLTYSLRAPRVIELAKDEQKKIDRAVAKAGSQGRSRTAFPAKPESDPIQVTF